MANPIMAPASPNGTRKVIVAPSLNRSGPQIGTFLIVWACSCLINVSMIVGAFVIFSFLGGSAPAADIVPEVENTVEQSDQKEYDLTNTDLGTGESDKSLAYAGIDRVEEVSVPGPVDPTAAVGIQGAPEGPPMNIPPPPGTGYGTGGAPIDPNVNGTGLAYGSVGGYGGIYNPGGFGGRSGSTKRIALETGGGNKMSEASVATGLEFLAHHQNSAGFWSLHDFNKDARTAPLPGGKVVPDNSQPMTTRRNNTAGTAFGLLPFLAAGITNRPSKDKTTQKDYTKAVAKAIDYLIQIQVKSGNDRGYYGGDMYSHGLATIAMCEAYGLTSDPKIKTSAQMGINYIVAAQDPAGGGWRYSPRTPGDTSVTGWQLMALKSGQMSGLTVPRTALKKVEAYLDSCETSAKGGYGYMPGTGETITMTGVGALCRQYLGVNPRNPSLLASIERIKKNPPGSGNVYYEYYATQVMHHMGGEAWQFWNLGPDGSGKGGIRDTLIARQDKGVGGKTGQRGSFAGNDHVGGRLGATSLCLLSLEVYYRHLPLYRRDAGMTKPDK